MDPITTGLALLERFVRCFERYADQGERLVTAMEETVALSENMTAELKKGLDEGKV